MNVNLRFRNTSKGKSYYLDYSIDGERIREHLKIPYNLPESERETIAKQIRADKEVAFLDGNYNRGQKMTRNFLGFFADHIDGHPSRDTRKYHNTLRHLKICFGALLTNQVNDRTMDKWKNYLLSNFEGETPLTMWKATRAIINQAKKEGLFSREPAPNVQRPKYERNISKEILFQDELKTLAQTPCSNDIVRQAFIFCCYTGMGYPEVKSLRWSQIADGRVRYKRTKTKKELTIKLSPSALSVLPERTHGRVFPLLPSDSYCYRILQDWVADAGIDKKISWYCARHTFAVLLLSAGVDIFTVSKLMGHASVSQTQVYLNYVDRIKDDAIDRLPEI